MSYTRHYSKDYKVPLHISVDCPTANINQSGETPYLSKTPGSVTIEYDGKTCSIPIDCNGYTASRDLSFTESVDVSIEVDTDPFDNSVSLCNNHVNALTGSVAATEVAQVASVQENSKKVASTIITGFFKNVQADISSKILELSQRVDSRLMHLREQAKTLQAKRLQMENDYQRTRSRYIKTFDDLNNELENRVKSLDEPIIKMASIIEKETERMINADFAEIASIIAKENTSLSSQIGTALTKKSANQAISKATEYLRVQKQTDNAISRSSISTITAEDGEYYLPVCFYEVNGEDGVVSHNCAYDKEHLPSSVNAKIEDEIFSNPAMLNSMHSINREKVEQFFSTSIHDARVAATDPHSMRVVNNISKLFYD